MTQHGTFPGGSGAKNRKIDDFCREMLTNRTVEDAARAAGISLRTAWRLLRDPLVTARLRELRRDVMDGVMQKLQDNATRAADNLDELQRTAESEAVRLAASKATLEFALRSVETIDVLERLAAIEQKLKSPEGRRNDTESSFTPAGASRGVNGRA
jgi:hypothetical protein